MNEKNGNKCSERVLPAAEYRSRRCPNAARFVVTVTRGPKTLIWQVCGIHAKRYRHAGSQVEDIA